MLLAGMPLAGMPLPVPVNEPVPLVGMPGRLAFAYRLPLVIVLAPIEPFGNVGGGGVRCGLLQPHRSIPPTSKAPIFSKGFDPIPFLLTP